MMKNNILWLLAISFVLSSFACAPKATLVPGAKVMERPEVLAIEKASWEQEEQKLVREAKKEGLLYIKGSMSPTGRIELTKLFKEKLSIDVEMVIGKSAELLPRLLAEMQAGLFTTDIFIGGPTDLINVLKPKGAIEPLDKVLFRPDVTDDSLWYGGLYFDKGHMMVGSSSSVSAPIAINTGLVNPEDIKSYRDLLNPKWKGKIIMGDPTVTGGQQSVAISIWMIMGRDFIDKLLEQNPVLSRDQRLIIEWLAREKYHIAVGPSDRQMNVFMEEGAPIQPITPVEGTKTTGTPVAVLMKNAPHPMAARFFMNWILTAEGQTLWMKNEGKGSRRKDVSNEWLHPENRIKQGINYLIDNEEFNIKAKVEFQPKLMEVFGPHTR